MFVMGLVKTVSKAYILLRQNNWMHRNLILAGNFNMTNVKELFQSLIELGQHPKKWQIPLL
jgi:amidophosphoribosyltransferase